MATQTIAADDIFIVRTTGIRDLPSWQDERDQLSRYVATADRDDQVLLTRREIRHWSTGDRRRHEHLADVGTGLLVVCAQPHTTPLRRLIKDALTGNHQGA